MFTLLSVNSRHIHCSGIGWREGLLGLKPFLKGGGVNKLKEKIDISRILQILPKNV